ncbi:MAG: hypothetical protein ACI9F9_002760, partial [Candidatus Paceibacteria bacterium]
MMITTLLLSFALGLHSGERSSLAPEAPSTIPADLVGRVVSLEAWPEHLQLDGPYSSLQLILSARLDDGSSIDITREAQYDSIPALVSVDERGLMRPASGRTGSETLALQFGGQTLDLQVSVIIPEESAPSLFVRDVMPILTKAGCTAGTCHGAADGQNGFKLSLRGYDPSADHRSLTDDLAGRRFNPVAPQRSLFLQKLTGAVPHEGGM